MKNSWKATRKIRLFEEEERRQNVLYFSIWLPFALCPRSVNLWICASFSSTPLSICFFMIFFSLPGLSSWLHQKVLSKSYLQKLWCSRGHPQPGSISTGHNLRALAHLHTSNGWMKPLSKTLIHSRKCYNLYSTGYTYNKYGAWFRKIYYVYFIINRIICSDQRTQFLSKYFVQKHNLLYLWILKKNKRCVFINEHYSAGFNEAMRKPFGTGQPPFYGFLI